jgi:DNA helicase-2/ATP-dependent DNA helicase PcrA
VGDDDQNLYSWRGAEPRNILEFTEHYPDAKVIKLEQNYRSTQNILNAAYAVIRKNKHRHDKRLWTEQGLGEPYRVYTATDERDEARFVAREVRYFLSDKRVRPKDIAILYRTNAQARVFEELLRTSQVESKVIGAQSFFERKEIKDVIAYLRVLANQKADSACERIINVPARGIGEATLEKLRTHATKHAVGLLGAARAAAKGEIGAGIKPATQRKLTNFVALIDDLDNFSKQGMSMAQIVVAVIERSNLRGKLEADESADSRERLDNLADLVTIASDTDHEARTSPADTKLEAAAAPATGEPVEVMPAAAELCTMCNGDGQPCSWCEGKASTAAEDKPRTIDEPQSIQAFLERIALSAPSDIGSKPVDAVSLMTIHIAKGLEWPIVFVVGLEDGLFPSIREREGTSEADSMEEERRLMYVAITRAREHLIISHARTRRQWGETKPQTPSRFLADLPEQGQ